MKVKKPNTFKRIKILTISVSSVFHCLSLMQKRRLNWFIYHCSFSMINCYNQRLTVSSLTVTVLTSVDAC